MDATETISKDILSQESLNNQLIIPKVPENTDTNISSNSDNNNDINDYDSYSMDNTDKDSHPPSIIKLKVDPKVVIPSRSPSIYESDSDKENDNVKAAHIINKTKKIRRKKGVKRNAPIPDGTKRSNSVNRNLKRSYSDFINENVEPNSNNNHDELQLTLNAPQIVPIQSQSRTVSVHRINPRRRRVSKNSLDILYTFKLYIFPISAKLRIINR